MIGVPFPSWRKASLANSLGTKTILSQPLAEQLLVTHELHLITKLRKKMHNRLLDWSEHSSYANEPSSRPSMISSITSERLEHSRHRSPINFLVNLVAELIASCHQPKKPSLGVQLPTLSEA
jgi:hypothetical protein